MLALVSLYIDDMQEPSSPDLIVPSPPAPTVVEAEPMDVDKVPAVTGDNLTEPQRMQRKLVSKTYVNDEGYMGDLLDIITITMTCYCLKALVTMSNLLLFVQLMADNILMLNCLVLSGLIVSEALRKSSPNMTIFFLQNFSLNSIAYIYL